MMFKEALDHLVKGELVTRAAWKSEYLVFLPGMLYIWRVATVPNPAAGNWIPLVQDLLADDWEMQAALIEATATTIQ